MNDMSYKSRSIVNRYFNISSAKENKNNNSFENFKNSTFSMSNLSIGSSVSSLSGILGDISTSKKEETESPLTLPESQESTGKNLTFYEEFVNTFPTFGNDEADEPEEVKSIQESSRHDEVELSFEPIKTIPGDYRISSSDYASPYDILAVGSSEGQTVLYDLASYQRLCYLPPSSLLRIHKGNLLLKRSSNIIEIYNTGSLIDGTFSLTKLYRPSLVPLSALDYVNSFDVYESSLITSGKGITLFDFNYNSFVSSYGQDDQFYDIQIKKTMIVASKDSSVVVFDTRLPLPVYNLPLSCAIRPKIDFDQYFLLTSEVSLYDIRTYDCIHTVTTKEASHVQLYKSDYFVYSLETNVLLSDCKSLSYNILKHNLLDIVAMKAVDNRIITSDCWTLKLWDLC